MSDVPTKAERDQWREDAEHLAPYTTAPDTHRLLRLLDALDAYENALRDGVHVIRQAPMLGWADHARALLDGNTDE